MIHYTCDMCGKDITSRHDRFLVCMDVRPADASCSLTEEDVDEDNLHELSEQLKELEASGDECLETDRPVKFHFDLCGRCRELFVKNPLARPVATKLNFSEN